MAKDPGKAEKDIYRKSDGKIRKTVKDANDVTDKTFKGKPNRKK